MDRYIEINQQNIIIIMLFAYVCTFMRLRSCFSVCSEMRVCIFFSCIARIKSCRIVHWFPFRTSNTHKNTVGLNLFAEIRDDNVKGENVDKSAG